MEESSARDAIDRLIAGFFAAFDNRTGSPEMASIMACFADKAVIAQGAGPGANLYTPIEFASPRIDLLSRGALVDFHEAETSATTRILGGIAIRTSRYSKVGVLDGAPYAGTGTKFFQLVALDCGWRIASLAWVDDAA